MMDLLSILFMIVLFLALKGFFSGSEIALVNADKIKLRHKARQGNKGAKMALKMFETPHVILGTTLVGTNIATVVLTTLGASLMMGYFGKAGDLYAFLIFTPLLLIFGEIVPKSVYQQQSDYLAPIIVYPLRFFATLFYPIVFIFSRIAHLMARVLGGGKTEQNLFITREQLRSILDMAERGSNVDVFDRERISRAIRFADTLVGEAMIPVAEMVAINYNRSTTDAISLVRRRGFNRLPVYHNNITNVTGIVTITTWDLLDKTLADQPLETLIKPAYYVSQLQTIDELLPVLREREDHTAIVVDEFGSAIGMITMEDILEEVVGEIDVGYDFEEYLPKRRRIFEMLDEETFLMDSRLPISEANDVLDTHLPTTEAHTIGGLVLSRLRHIPKAGESTVIGGFCFTVEEASERAILKLRVEPE
ncbi:hemolysin family protein [Candidatus Albibeggiatoa sp. nov. NOAA]|uniref:hemolysin family protein n=1 Tax=Candidatus Albibeggiatoa sp. nov. NOAA TaxID=3162724 RepID=UPI0033001196|nr:hemolysin family protein [Thiotrichaceae bacterium]